MAVVGFYHLTRSPLAQALPQLLVRSLAAGQRACVLSASAAGLAALSDALWAHAAWLPHGTAEDGDAPLQPIWLSTDDPKPPNGARYLFLTEGADTADFEPFERIFDLFDGNDPAQVGAARDRWKRAKQNGHQLTYWQQTADGWQKKA